jgi:uncharacterized protein YigE (DUF2233 family)
MDERRVSGMGSAARIIMILILGLAAFAAQADPAGSTAREPACQSQDFDGSSFLVCRWTPGAEELRLDWTDAAGAPLRRFDNLERALGPSAARVRFAMNAGMFEDDGLPLGLFIADGRTLSPLNRYHGFGNFYLKPNGVFSVSADGRARIEATDAFASAARKTVWATQSGPMLVVDGELHPAIQPDGPSRLVRNGVGVGADGSAYFVISQSPVSFGKLARLFRDGLHCPNALFLDGTVSSLWAPALRRRDDARLIGPIVTVLDRAG